MTTILGNSFYCGWWLYHVALTVQTWKWNETSLASVPAGISALHRKADEQSLVELEQNFNASVDFVLARGKNTTRVLGRALAWSRFKIVSHWSPGLNKQVVSTSDNTTCKKETQWTGDKENAAEPVGCMLWATTGFTANKKLVVHQRKHGSFIQISYHTLFCWWRWK